MTLPSTAAIKVFYSYAHEDERLRKELDTHLALLQRQKVIEGWNDREMSAGTEWKGEIDQHLEDSHIILLLISADFLASDYCYDREMKRALEKHETGEARIIPIIIRPVDWHGAPFSKLQPLPQPPRAVTTWSNRDEAWENVAKGIRKVIEEIQARHSMSRSTQVGIKSSAALVPESLNSNDLSVVDTTGLNHSPPQKEVYLSDDRFQQNNRIHIFIGDAGFENDSPVALVGCIIREDPSPIRKRVEEIRNDLLHDRLILNIPEAENSLRKIGFNYLTDDPAIRTLFIGALRGLMFTAYVCFAYKERFTAEVENGEILFERLLGRLIYERLRANKSRPISVWFSRKYDRAFSTIQQIVADRARDVSRNDRNGTSNNPTVAIAKFDPCFAVADYTFRLVQRRLASPRSVEARDFEKVRSKIRVIHNFVTDEFYTRKNPLP